MGQAAGRDIPSWKDSSMDQQLSAVAPIGADTRYGHPVVTGCPAGSARVLASAADLGGVAA